MISSCNSDLFYTAIIYIEVMFCVLFNTSFLSRPAAFKANAGLGYDPSIIIIR